MKQKLIKVSVASLSILLGLCLYILLVGFELDAKRINQEIESTLSESLGRKVVVDGPSRFTINARPSVILHGLHIANPVRFASEQDPDLFSIQEAKLSLNLWGLLVGKVIIDNVSGDGLSLALKQDAAGHNNWTFKQTDDEEDPDNLAFILSLLERADFKNITLSHLKVSFTQADNQPYFFDLQQLQAHLTARDDVSISLKGSLEKTLPYEVHLQGGRLNELIQLVQVQQLIEKPNAESLEGWPFKLALSFLNSDLQLDGRLHTQQANFKLKLNTPDLKKFGHLLNLDLPNAGLSLIESHVQVSQNEVRLNQLHATLGQSKLDGQLSVNYHALPILQGEINLPILDLTPFLQDEETNNSKDLASTEASATNLLGVYQQLLAKDIDLSGLKLFNADLKLKIQSINGLPGSVSDASARLLVKHGQLKLPMQLNLAQVKLNGQLQAGENRSGSAFNMQLWTKEEPIGELADFLLGLKGIKGQLGKFNLAIQAQGKNVHEALARLNIEMHLSKSALSYGNTEGGKSINFEIDALSASLPPLKPLVLAFTGKLLNQALSIKLNGSSIDEITNTEQGQLTFSAQSKNTKIQAVSQYSLKASNPSVDVDFNIDTPDIREIEDWLGIAGTPALPFTLTGSLRSEPNAVNLKRLTLKLANSDLNIHATQTLVKQKKLLSLRIESALLDIQEIQSIFPEKKAAPPNAAANNSSAFNFNVPILPKGLDLSDTDVNLLIKKTHGTTLPLSLIKMNGRIRDGYMNQSPFSATIDGVNYEGAALLDARSTVPSVKFWLNANQVNIGSILKKLNITENVDAVFGNVNFYLASQASLLGELIAQAKLIAVLNDGSIKIQYPNTQSSSNIMIQSGVLETLPNQNATLKMSGMVNQSPIKINLITSTTKDLIAPNKPIPIDLSVDVANSSLRLSGALSRLTDRPSIHLTLDMRGNRLNDLNSLLEASLPPWGPWSLSGSFNMDNNRYAIDDLNLKVGESHLQGKGKLSTNVSPAFMEVFLNAETIQLNDFSTQQWHQAATDKKPNAPQKKPLETKSFGQQLEALLNPEMLKKANLNLEVAVKQVNSGRDRLGKGTFQLKLENGIAFIGPASIETDGGTAFWSLKFHPRPKDIQMNLNVDMRHFDYGIIARRIQPNTDIKGQLSLNMNIDSNAPHIADLMAYGNGHLNVLVWPENQKSGVLDLWAVNLLSGLLPVIDPSTQSKINCAIGKFQLKNGLLKEKQLQIDTTKMRVTGTLLADFKSEEIYTQLRPQAKEVQFLSLATPVKVTGKFSNFNIGLSVGDIAETVVRLGTSIFWVPLKKLFAEKMVSDGSDICLSAD
jgi:AsmA family protein